MSPRVSVIVPIYNGESDLPELINCLQDQSYSPELLELLLVDNLSSDATATIIKSIASSRVYRGPRISYLTQRLRSSYAARNTGIRAAKGEILVFTDVDCRPQRDWVEHLIEALSDPAIGIVAGNIGSLEPGLTFIEKYSCRRKMLSQEFTLDNNYYPYGQTANIAVRREVFEEIGMFRPWLRSGGDADLCWRMLNESPWRLAYTRNKPTVLHRHRRTLSGLIAQFERYGGASVYLESLHGHGLESSCQKPWRRLARWLIKELPKEFLAMLSGERDLVDLCATPLDIARDCAFARGQEKASFEENMRIIEHLDNSSRSGANACGANSTFGI